MGRGIRNCLCALSLLLVAEVSRAAEGVIELNQACAEGNGCLAGDSSGFPVTIGSSGSYRLTSDLVVLDPGGNKSAVQITASYVTLDLGGFEIAGAVTCSGTPPVCAPAFATGDGVAALFFTEGVEVRNGSVTGFDNGVSLEGRNGSVDGVRARGNRAFGVIAGPGSRVAHVSAAGNGGFGIGGFVGAGSLFEGCVAEGNRGHGMAAATGSLVSDSTFRGDSGAGVVGASLFLGVSASENGLEGMRGDGPALVVQATATGNAGDGISSGISAHPLAVNRSIVRNNGDSGLVFSGTGAYRENVITGNAVVPVSGGADRAGNYCAGAGTLNPTCP